ncbi:MAG: COX15/CtaA family protein [Bacteroidetes bacterium]|nr:COX15/CtaA family protein [Bacteroidota bacterium]
MVAIGGITRLTDSGLSMVDWRPIMGSLPPLNQAEWQASFNAYKSSPEYIELNNHFTLSDYKGIFWWEFIHRSIGRLLGIVFIIPFIFFVARKRIKGNLLKWCLVILSLGALQGYLGWYMVESGLFNRPYVSQFRLAIHLSMAFTIISVIWWVLLMIQNKERNQSGGGIRALGLAFFALVCIQIIYGAFVAGLDAGLVHNTWPLMDGYFIHPASFGMDSLLANLTENKSGVQFVHRTLGIIVFVFGLFLFSRSRHAFTQTQKNALTTIAIVVILQFILGIATLLAGVPLLIAVLHQLGALTLLLASVRVIYYFKR